MYASIYICVVYTYMYTHYEHITKIIDIINYLDTRIVTVSVENIVGIRTKFFLRRRSLLTYRTLFKGKRIEKRS